MSPKNTSLPTGARSQKVPSTSTGTDWVAFVDNLSRRVSRKALWDYFKHHGEVVRVFIPLVNRKPKYKDSTFAFVHFRCKEDMENAIAKVNNAIIDRRKVFVGAAKFARREAVRAVWRNSTVKAGKNQAKQNDVYKQNFFNKFVDGSSYKDVLAKPKIQAAAENLFNVVVPAKEKEWMKHALTGVARAAVDLSVIQRALKNVGLDVKLVRWGFVWNSCIIIFPSEASLMEARTTKRDELLFWFSWVDRLVLEIGVPMAFCSAELSGVPLNCWNDSFFTDIANRWGSLVHIHEETRDRKDMTIAKLLLRVVSPFDVPSQFTIRTDGRPYKIRVKIGSASVKPVVNLDLPCSEVEWAGKESPEDVDGGRSEWQEEDYERSLEESLNRVSSWLEEGLDGGNPETAANSHLLQQTKKKVFNNEEESDFLKTTNNVNGEFEGLGLRNFGSPSLGAEAHYEIEEEAANPIKRININGPTVNIVQLGYGAHNKDIILGKNKSSLERLSVGTEHKSWESLSPAHSRLSTRSAPAGWKGRWFFDKVYSRSVERRCWFRSEKGEEGEQLVETARLGGLNTMGFFDRVVCDGRLYRLESKNCEAQAKNIRLIGPIVKAQRAVGISDKASQSDVNIDNGGSSERAVGDQIERKSEGVSANPSDEIGEKALSGSQSAIGSLKSNGEGFSVAEEIDQRTSKAAEVDFRGRVSSKDNRRIHRSVRRNLLLEALEKVSSSTASSHDFKEIMEEAMATWEVSNMLGVSFEGGKQAFLEKVISLELRERENAQ